MYPFNDLIAGGLAAEGLLVANPVNGAHLATVRVFNSSQTIALVNQAESGRREWASETAKSRAAILRRWNDLILEREDALARLVTAESGKPLSEARAEVRYAASFIEWFAEEGKRAYGEVIPTFAPGKRILTLRQPVGTCVAITPWNFPLAMITRKVAPALAAGCSIIVKPAEATPLSAVALEHLALKAGLPAPLFKVVPTTDPAAMGKLLLAHPAVRKLSFTGSTAVGKLLLRQCADTVKRTSMELGGNAPFILFDDADLEAAIEGVMLAKFRNAGQTCVSANRILVQDSIHDRFVAMLAERVASLSVGDGADEGTKIGPLINVAAALKVEALVNDALDAGASAVVGGARHPLGGSFFQPTVLVNATPAMAISNSEIFGPVAPITRFRTEEEAVALANATPYGLAAYVFTGDVGRIWRTMERLDYGMMGVNDAGISSENVPFGGIKESGFGREGSRHGLSEYLDIKYALMGGL